jgi:hypothetical protein
MPTSRSPRRDAKPLNRDAKQPGRNAKPPGRGLEVAARSRVYWPIVLIGLIAVLAVIIAVLPASIVTHFLPPAVHAEDFSGSIWHGSAGKFSVDAKDAGALEWRVNPRALLGMTVAADLHWVKVGFVIDAAVKIDRHGIEAHDIKGSGPIEDLRDFGVPPGWHGTATVNFSELKADFSKPLAAAGDVKVSNLSSAQIDSGAELGSYDLILPEGAIDADGNVTAQLVDTGGPLEVQALVHFSQKDLTGTLSGTVKERSGVPPTLHSQLENFSQLRPKDAQGRIPVDVEFRL